MVALRGGRKIVVGSLGHEIGAPVLDAEGEAADDAEEDVDEEADVVEDPAEEGRLTFDPTDVWEGVGRYKRSA